MSTNHRMILPLALFLSAGALLACKRPSTSEVLTEQQKGNIALEETGKWVDYGIAELNSADNLVEAEPEVTNVMGLSGRTTVPRPFANLVRNVQTQWQNARKNPCSIWKPLLRSANGGLLRPYFFVGASAEAGVGIHGVIGRDIVWDLYNIQLATFNYKSLEAVLGSGTAGAGINTYLGLAFGVRDNVDQAWSGQFAATGMSGSLPVLSDYLSVHANYFTAVNHKGAPDLSLLGASVGLSLALSVPTAVPGALQISQGNWVIDPATNQLLSRKFSLAKIPHAIAGRETCNGRCIRFDNQSSGKGYTGRMVNLIRSIPAVLIASRGGGYSPHIEKIVLLALAVGAYRDSLNATYLCRG